MRKILQLTLCIVLMVTMLPLVEARAKTKYLSVGTCRPSSSQFGYVVGMAKAINKYAKDIKVTVVETGATVDNIKRMENKQVDFGLVTVGVTYQAYHGIGKKWKNNSKPWLRMLWVYMRGVDNYVVREDSGVKKLSDLTGKKFNPGFRGSATEATCEEIFDLLGIKPKYYRGGIADAVQAIKDKRIVGYLKTGAGLQLDASTKDIMSFTPIRILSFNKKQLELVKKKMPWVLIVHVPAGVVKGMEKMGAYTSWGMAIGFAAPKDFPENYAYQIVKAIDKGIGFQKAGYPGCFDDIPKTTLSLAKTPLHPGAVRYYKERGLNIPDSLIPPEMKK